MIFHHPLSVSDVEESWKAWVMSGKEIEIDVKAITNRKMGLEKIKKIDPQTSEVAAFIGILEKMIQEAESGLKNSIAASATFRAAFEKAEKEFLLYGQIDNDALDRIHKMIKEKESLESLIQSH